MKGKPVAEQEIGKQLLNETVSYAESSVCDVIRFCNILVKFYQEDNCHTCDNL